MTFDHRCSQDCRIPAVLVALLLAGLLILPARASEPILGIVEEVIPLEMPCVDESKAGNAVADAWRDALGTEVALVPGGLLGGPLPAGGQTKGNLASVFTRDTALVTAELTESQLKELLEIGVSNIKLTEEERIDREASAFEGFLQVSGFSFLYDASAPVGERIDEITLDSGLSLLEDDVETRITAVMPAEMARGQWGFPSLTGVEESGMTALGCLAQWLADHGTVGMPADGRIRIRGCNEQSIFSEYIPLWVVVPAMILLTIPRFWMRKREREEEF